MMLTADPSTATASAGHARTQARQVTHLPGLISKITRDMPYRSGLGAGQSNKGQQ